MIKKLITLLLLITLYLPGVAQKPDVATVSTWNNAGNTGFSENKGQVTNLTDGTPNTDVRFMMENGDAKLFLMNGGLAWQFNKVYYPGGYHELMRDPSPAKQEQAHNMAKDIRLETWRMDMTLVGANKKAKVIAEERSSDFVNYYNHNALDVHSYRKVTYLDIYEGIDWVIYLSGEQVKYDFIVHPGADASQIVIRYSDYETLRLNEDGSCSLGNSMGMITENAPASFQDGKTITTQFVLEGNTLRFALGAYNNNKTLVIDPIVREWGTYYGGSTPDNAYSCTTDPSGNVYMTGVASSSSGIASGGHQNTLGGNYDAMLVKFTASGTRLWATYYGGSAADYSDQCITDASGNIYMSGYTLSTSSIAYGGHQNTAGGGYDVYLAKFNAAGTLQWCTYYGGPGADMQSSCTTDASGNVFLSAFTSSTSAIASGGHQNTYGGGTSDAFLVKFNSNGVRQWATYYGGSGGEKGHGCATDASGNVYWVGEAESTSGIASGGHQNTLGGGTDAFLVKFDPAGVRQWATYYGGSGTEFGVCCQLDAAGNIYLAGSTGSSTSISSGGHQNTFGGNTYDGFLVKFNSAGVRQWGTYYGDSGYDVVHSGSIDADGNIYIGGTTNSTAAISSGGYQNTNAGDFDAFVAKFNTSGVREWGTYYGGPSAEWGYGMHVTSTGLIYLCGSTQSTSGIAANGFLNTSSSQDAFLVKLTALPAAALNFDGSNDIVSIPANPAFDFTTGTVECWFNSASSSGNNCVLAMRTNTSGARWSIHVNENTNEVGIFNGAAFTALPATINPNTWYHLAVVMNSTSSIFYLNGVNIGTIALGIQTSATGLPLTIGGHTDPAWPEYFNGSIDEVRIWNRALCASEITSCMSGETPAFSNGLIADYHFNQGYDGANNTGTTTLIDASGNNRNGTLQNFTLNGTTSNWIAPGAIGSGSNATPVITTTVSALTNVSCNGGNNGSITVTATGAGPFTYSWAPSGGSSATATGLAAGTYSCTVSNGCASSIATVTITEPAAISFSAVVTHISCNSSFNNGAIDLTVTGGTGPFTYAWSFGYTTEDLSNLDPGTYAVTVTDANGCTATSSQFSVSYNSTLSSSVSVAPFPCNGTTTTATMTAINGTAPYSYSWSPSGGNAATSTPIGSGTYFCTVTDANGCTSSQSFSITQPAALTASAAVTSNYNGFPITCYGSYDGQITSTVSGGTGPYTYQWSNGMITPIINGVTMGVYTYTVTDVNGCSTTANVVVTSPAVLNASVATTNVSCNGNSNGAINLSMSGGAGSYSYGWSNSATTEDINGLTPGTYSVTITDVNGCTTTASTTITQPPLLTSASSATSIACNGGTATVTVTGSGGTSPYSGTGTFSVTAGTYSFTVTDANGCTSTTSGTITQPPLFTAVSSATSIACNGGTATVTVTGSGGISPYTGQGTFTVTAGTYSYPVTDANGCTSTTSITVTQPSLLTTTSSATSIACNGGTATVTVTGSGGTSPYSGTGTFTVTAGTYSYPVTDANGCTSTTSITVTQPSLLTTASSATAIACNGGNATVTVTGSGGTSPYSGTGTFTVTAGTYSYPVTDANGCTSTTSITVTQPSLLTSASSATSIACNGGTATVIVTGSGGTSPYSGTGTFTVTAGTYSYPVTDANGCTSTTSITVTQPALLSSASSATAILCNGGNATVTVTGSGGTSPYSGTGTFTVTAGTYSYPVTDANGCTSTTSITVTEPAMFASASSATAILCNGGTATVTVTGSGGTSPYTGEGTFTESAGTYSYTVTDVSGCTSTTTITVTEPILLTTTSSATAILCNGGNATVTVTGSGGTSPYTGEGAFTESAGTYSYTVTDANGCTSTTSITVTEPTLLTTASSATAILCNGGTATVTVTGSGGTSPYTGEGTFTESAGTYSYTVTDVNGCTSTTTITVMEPAVLSASVLNAVNPTTCGGTDGSIDISVTGGTTSYSFLWNNSDVTEDLTAIGAGSYSVTITDANGCTTTATASVNDPGAPTVTLVLPMDTACGDFPGIINLSGGSPAGGTFSGTAVSGNTFDPFTAGMGLHYITYTFTDINGCTGNSIDSIFVNNCLGIQTISTTAQWNLFPNPTNGAINITTTAELNSDVIVEIYSVDGKLIQSENKQQTKTITLEMTGEPVGVYFIRITANGNVSMHRVVKM